MATVNREMIENLMLEWEKEGKRVGALKENYSYDLQHGKGWTAFFIYYREEAGYRHRMSDTQVPHLTKNIRMCYDILDAMVKAWRMIPEGKVVK